MKTKVHLNLATKPFWNSRLSLAVNGFLSVVLVVLVGLSLIFYFLYSDKTEKLRASSRDAQSRVSKLQKENLSLNDKIADLSGLFQKKTDFLNQVIRKKSFSWSDFLSDLEELLPDYSYIVSLSPQIKGETEIEVYLKMASPGLGAHLQFLENLYRRNFKVVRVNNESPSERGYLLSEVSFVYKGLD